MPLPPAQRQDPTGTDGTASAAAVPVEELLEGVRTAWFGDRPLALWLSAERPADLGLDEAALDRLPDLVPPDSVLVFGASGPDGGLTVNGRTVATEALAGLLAAAAPGRVPVLTMPGGDRIAHALASLTRSPAIAGPHGVDLGPGAGTLTGPAVDGAGPQRLRVFDGEHEDGVPVTAAGGTVALVPGTDETGSTQDAPAAAASSGPVTAPEEGTGRRPSQDGQEAAAPNPDDTGLGRPVDVDPAARTIGIPRAGLPHLPAVIRTLRAMAAEAGAAVPEQVWNLLPHRLLSNYRYLVAGGDDAADDGLLVPLGEAEALITLDPRDPRHLRAPAPSYDRPSTLPTIQEEPENSGADAAPVTGPRSLVPERTPGRDRFRANEGINSSYLTGAFVRTHAGSTSATRGGISLSFGIGLTPGVPQVARVGVGVSGTANASSRSTSWVGDAEGGHVETAKSDSVMLAYQADWSVRLRTDALRAWDTIEPVRVVAPDDRRLLLYVPEYYLGKAPEQQVTATGTQGLERRVPAVYYASGLTGLPTLFDRIVAAARQQNLDLPVGSVQREELLQKLWNLESHLDAATGGGKGYAFTLHSRYGKPIATVHLHTERTSRGVRVGTTTDKAPIENVRTAIDGTSGGHTLGQSHTLTFPTAEINLLPVPARAELGVGVSASLGMTWSTSDGISAGRTGLWVVVPRDTGLSSAYRLELTHSADVAVRGAGSVRTPEVHGQALLRTPEPEAFRYGFPVDPEALVETGRTTEETGEARRTVSTGPVASVAQGEAGLTVPYRPGLVRGTEPRRDDSEHVNVPPHVAEGRGIGTGLVEFDDETVQELRDLLGQELRRLGFLPADASAPLARARWWRHGNRVNSLLQNEELFDKYISRRGLESHFDQLHQTGVVLTLVRPQGLLGVDIDLDAVRITVRARPTPGQAPEFLGPTRTKAVVNLAMGMETGGQSTGGSRQIALSLRAKALFNQLKGAVIGFDVKRTVGATETVSFLNNRPELLEYNGVVHKHALPVDLTVTLELEHSGLQGRVRRGARNPQPLRLPGRRVLAYLPPLGSAERTAARPQGPTPASVLDRAVVYHVDATGLRDAAVAVLGDLTGPQGHADQELTSFTSTIQVRSHFKEMAYGRYSNDQFFDPGLRDTNAAVDIRAVLGPSAFAGFLDDFVLGDISLWMSQTNGTDSSSNGVSWAQAGVTVGGSAGVASVSGEVGATRGWQWNRSSSQGRTGAEEMIRLAFGRGYVFRAETRFEVRSRLEKTAKLLPNSYRSHRQDVTGRTVMYVLAEADALEKYAAGDVPLPDERLVDVMNRWHSGELRLSGNAVAGVLSRWSLETPEPGQRPRTEAAEQAADHLARLSLSRSALADVLVKLHDNGALPVLDEKTRTAFAARFGVRLSDPAGAFPDVSLPEYLTRRDGAGNTLGHSAVHAVSYDGGRSTYDIVREQVDAVAPGLLAAQPELWTGGGRRIGRLQSGVNILQSLLAEGRDTAMWEDLLSPNGHRFYLVNPMGWLLSDVVEITLRATLDTTPEAHDFKPYTGLEKYGHGYASTSTSTSRDVGQSFTAGKLGAGGANASGNAGVGVGQGAHRGVTRAETATAEQTTYAYNGTYLFRTQGRLSVSAQAYHTDGQALNNWLGGLYRRWAGVPATSSSATVAHTLTLQVPRGLAELSPQYGPQGPRDLRPLPELPGDAYVAGTLLDDALPVALRLMRALFRPTADGTRTRTSPTVPQLMSRGHMANQLLPAAAGRRLLLAETVFVPGRSSRRARLFLTGDLYDLEVIGPVHGTGTGRYIKHQSGTTVNASNDRWRPNANAGLSGSGVMNQHNPAQTPDGRSHPPNTASGSASASWNTSSNVAGAAAENYRREQHIKQLGPVHLVRLRARYRLEAERHNHHLLRSATREGSVVRSDPFTGDVYVEMFEAEVEELRARLEQTVPPALEATAWAKLDQARTLDLVALLETAAEVPDVTPSRLYQWVVRQARAQHAAHPQALVLRIDRTDLAARARRATLRWAVETLRADLQKAWAAGVHVVTPESLGRYEGLLDGRQEPPRAEGAEDTVWSIVADVDRFRRQATPGTEPVPPAGVPRLAALAEQSMDHMIRAVAHDLDIPVRLDTVDEDGRTVTRWAEPSGRVHAFDPRDPDAPGVGDLTSEQAWSAGLLTDTARTAADKSGLDAAELGALYRTSWHRGRSLDVAVDAAVSDRLADLGFDIGRRVALRQAWDAAERLGERTTDDSVRDARLALTTLQHPADGGDPAPAGQTPGRMVREAEAALISLLREAGDGAAVPTDTDTTRPGSPARTDTAAPARTGTDAPARVGTDAPARVGTPADTAAPADVVASSRAVTPADTDAPARADVHAVNDAVTDAPAPTAHAVAAEATAPAQAPAITAADAPGASYGAPPVVDVSPDASAGPAADLYTPPPAGPAAEVAAAIVVTAPGAVPDRPVAARNELLRQLTRVLHDPVVAENVRSSGVRVLLVPRGTPVTEVPGFENLRDLRTHDTDARPRPVAAARGLTDVAAGIVVVAEENLLGEDPGVTGAAAHPDGYSSVLHELAHMVYFFGLGDADRASVQAAYEARLALGPDAEWADGPRRDTAGRAVDNYASTGAEEYFAQTSNAHLGANHGHDPYTGRPRNNGASWVRENDAALAPLLDRLYGPEPDAAAPGNPVVATRTGDDALAAARDLDRLNPQADEAVRPALGRSVTSFGTERDGAQGLVHVAAVPEETVDWLREQVFQHVEDGRGADPDFRQAVRTTLTSAYLSSEWARLFSEAGLPLRAPYRGDTYQVSLRFGLSEPRRAPAGIEEMPDGPPVNIQRWMFGISEAGNTDSAGDLRSATLGHAHTVPFAHTGWFRRLTVTPQLTYTHNQSTTSVSVGATVQPMVLLRSRERSWPVEYTLHAQVRTTVSLTRALTEGPAPNQWHTPAEPAPAPLTVWFPKHLIDEEPAPETQDATGPQHTPAPMRTLLDQVPLFATETVPHADRLLADVLRSFEHDLAGLSESSLDQLRGFLDEGAVRGNLPLMYGGHHSSPTLYAEDGRVIGMLRLHAEVAQRTGDEALAGPTTINSVLESHVLRSVRLTSTAAVTNAVGVGLSVSGGFALGSREQAGGTEPAGLTLTGQAAVQQQVTHALTGGGSARTSRSLRTAKPLLRVHADAVYEVTLVRPDGQEQTPAEGSPLARGTRYPLILRVPSAATVSGTPSTTRHLPPEVLHLRDLGVSTTPLAVDGTGPLFDALETWLADHGFLPPRRGRADTWYHGPVSGATHLQRLNNQRKLDQLRSAMGLRAGLDEMTNGGHPVWFELPTVTGVRRVSFRIAAERRYPQDQEQGGVTHDLHLSDVQTLNYSGSTLVGDEQVTRVPLALSGTVQASLTNPFDGHGNLWLQGLTPEYTYSRQSSRVTGSSAGSGHEFYALSPTADGVQVFTLPVTYRATMSASHDTAMEPVEAQGRVALAVPTYRTLDTPAERVPAAAARPRPEAEDDAARFAEAVRLPETAWVDRAGGSRALRDAVNEMLAAHRPDHAEADEAAPAARAGDAEDGVELRTMPGAWPAPVPEATAEEGAGPVPYPRWAADTLASLRRAVRAAVDRAGAAVSRVGELAVGGRVEAPEGVAQEVVEAGLSPHHLVANAYRLFNDSYVIEGAGTSGVLLGTDITVEVEGHLTGVRALPRPGVLDYERWIQSVDAAADTRGTTRAHAAGVTVAADYGSPARPFAPAGHYARRRGVTDSTTTHDTSAVFRVTSENDVPAHRFAATAVYKVTVRGGWRNVVAGTVAGGPRFEDTRVVEVPDGVEFLLSDNDLVNHPEFLLDGTAEPPAAAPADRALPAWFTGSGGRIGFGSVVEMLPARPEDGRSAFQRTVHRLVEQIAPGSTVPGTATYRHVMSRVNEHTTSLGLRTLVNAGPDGHTAFHFVHNSWLGPMLVEVALRARPAGPLDAVRGRRAAGNPGLDNVLGHTSGDGTSLPVPGSTRQTRATTITDTLDFSPLVQRNGHRFRPTVTASRQSGTADAALSTRERRAWQRSMLDVTEFHVDYRIEATVSAVPVSALPGGASLRAVLDGLTGLTDGLVRRLPEAARVPLEGLTGLLPRAVQQVSDAINVRAVLRFNGSETPAGPETPRPLVEPALLTADPSQPPEERPGETVIDMEVPAALRDALAGPAWLPRRPFTVYDMAALPQLAQALRAVDPSLDEPGRLPTSTSAEGILVRLTQLARTGRVTLLRPAASAAFLGGPGAEGTTVRLSLHAPRVEAESLDTAIDRVEIATDGAVSQGDLSATEGLGFGFSAPLDGAATDRLGPTVPVAGQRTSAGLTHTQSAPRREMLRFGTPMAGASRGAPGHRIRAVGVLRVSGPAGTRWVVGDIVLRTTEAPPGGPATPAADTAATIVARLTPLPADGDRGEEAFRAQTTRRHSTVPRIGTRSRSLSPGTSRPLPRNRSLSVPTPVDPSTPRDTGQPEDVR
ncbi:hypothetical protein ACFQMH_31725 [Streptomyces viridiviolaceus]|uniref:Uncharacterized protein n=1 Tax=Streptomyces viridiviolaceus TaxID=68282 RepID=A0ABW2EBK8_9ACTN